MEACKLKIVHKAEVGQLMGDGTVYLGISPTTRKPLFALFTENACRMSSSGFSKLKNKKSEINELPISQIRDEKELTVKGKYDGNLRLPTVDEMKLLWENKDILNIQSAGYYLTCTLYIDKLDIFKVAFMGPETETKIGNPRRRYHAIFVQSGT